ncbi:MAG: glycine--tRNA ligase subunit beta [Nitrospira sp.]|nr:glycine--tRNA ligase subunit beta [Nitrospira sp.]
MVRLKVKTRRQQSGQAIKRTRKLAKRPHADSQSGELLFEIGTEELPYQFVSPALDSCKGSAERLFKEHRLTHGTIRAFGTPRRLTLAVEALSNHQAATVKEAMGPSKAVAFDATGQPTKAALGFAAGQGVEVHDLIIRQTAKGDYVFAVKRDPGRTASVVLAEILPQLIGALSFPKSMRWNETGVRFARPIRWILALYAGKSIEFQVGAVRVGNRTWGHRFLSAGAAGGGQGFCVKDTASYLAVLERHGVVLDQERRRKMIHDQIESLAKSVRGQVHRDEELLEQAVYTVECPHAILGSFNPQYLSLPKEILITSMKEHQGFFSVIQRDGSLLPQFISVTNMKLANMNLIREGNERVLAARLADAKFFFDEDRKSKLADRVEKLKGVVFHQKLGTLYEKQQRVRQLVERLAVMFSFDEDTRRASVRAAELCKADLTTGIVGEFPALQGIMGGDYAKHDGETDAVCRAIAEQYLPPSMEGNIPQTPAGRVLSLADRLDTIFAFFRVGLVPSGSEDPFALRRNALAVVRIALEGQLPLNLSELSIQGFDSAINSSNIPIQFILDRLAFYGLTVDNMRADVASAILSGPLRNPRQFSLNLLDLYAKIKALQAITTRPEFDPLMVGFKRAHRLVEKENWKEEEVNPVLFQHPAEEKLHMALEETRLQVPYAIEQMNYETALEGLVRLKPAIDAFFTNVMVNTEEQGLRANRLSLLRAVDQLFLKFADFSQITVQGT